MIIYNSSSGNRPFGSAPSKYKSGSKRKKTSNREKVVKRGARRGKPKRKVEKNKKKSRNKRLNAANIKFLKKLGFKVNKH